ncbi:MAG: acetate--CoA ligase family protein [Planctomycetes bacterium]|nr:acetate--CoA ligase family protein [Planctomycetota bacterium]
MARLHEYEGKALLREARIAIPRGNIATTPDQVEAIAATIGGPVVVKIQAWTTKRAEIGGLRFADTPSEAAAAAGELLGMRVASFEVDTVLVEERLDIRDEYYAAVVIDDAAHRPLLLFGTSGGSGIEDRAAAGGASIIRHHYSLHEGLPDYDARNLVRRARITGRLQRDLAAALVGLTRVARKTEARTVEINPLVVTTDGRVVAADCRLAVDDYAVYRHPELGIEIARELDHPPTELERISYEVEKQDHRGTFFFVQLATGFDRADGYVGFHGAGGGGSMMSMDALTAAGFKLANFTDTSGNPSAAKVYRAARIILSQPNLNGYFGSGSGVASQEQYHSAYGLAKAFHEVNLSIPTVIRLGGNSEDRAVQILSDYCKHLPAPVEGYKKDDTPAHCAERFRALVNERASAGHDAAPVVHRRRSFTAPPDAYSFKITGGTVYIDHSECDAATNKVLMEYGAGVFKIENGKPVLAIDESEAAGMDSELIACEVECRARANDAVYVDLPIEGLDEC